MTDIVAAAAAETPEVPLIDFDAGEDWGVEIYTLARPFKSKGVTYRTVEVRIPSGGDVDACIHGRNPIAEMTALAVALTGLTAEAFARMYARDRGEIMTIVGKHIADVRPSAS